uniref:Transmembrane p24 trafficking protein 4 n=1 Tax=Ovis aries TaxID=9940 RepID=A0AC11E5M2_SHEEP
MRTGQRARVGRCLGWASAGDGVAGVAAPCAVRGKRPGTLFPHRRDRKALLHRRNPRRDHGNYRTQMWDKQKEVFLPSTPGLGMHVEVKDPEGKVVLSRQYGSEGRFTFTSHTPGDHQICLHSNSTRMALFAGGRLRVHLDIQVGEHANNYPEIAAKDKLTELQLRARQLLDQVEQIQKEQDYQRYREERFRLISESTNQRVLWWSIAQTVILILTGIWQMRHLKSFFEAKKLV